MSDKDTIRELLAGEPDTVMQVRSWIRISSSPYRGRLGADLEDLEQEILLELTLTLREGGFREESRLRTFVRTCVHHKCIDRMRAQARRRWVSVDDLELVSKEPSSFERVASAQTAEIALEVLEELGEGCRGLFEMLREGASYREMSERLGVGEGALRARVLRCRRRAIAIRERVLLEKGRNKTPSPTTRK